MTTGKSGFLPYSQGHFQNRLSLQLDPASVMQSIIY